jgi:hypothetical protein
VAPPDILVVELGRSNGSETCVALVEMGLLTEDINYDHDHIKPVCLWELNDEVHQDGVPALLQDLHQVKFSVLQPLEGFSLDAWITGADVLADVLGQLGPPVVSKDELQCLEGVFGYLRVEALHHDLLTDVLVLQDNDLAAKLENPVGDSPLG